MAVQPEDIARLTDDEFLAGFEDCTIVPFHHRDHVRAAWIYLRRHNYAEAASHMAESVRRFAIRHNVPAMYHETVTQAWMQLVHAAMLETPEEQFGAFIARHAELLNKHALEAFYSSELLASEQARAGWVPPDLQPLP